MPTLLDEIAELLLRALAQPIPPEQVGFVYVHRGGQLSGVEELVECDTRELADNEARRLEKKWGGELVFVRQHKVANVASPLLTRKEAAAYLRIGVRTLARLKIAPIKVRGRVFYTQEILDAWLDTRKPRAGVASRSVDRSSPATAPRAAARRSAQASPATLTEADRRNVELLSRPRKTNTTTSPSVDERDTSAAKTANSKRRRK